MTGPTTPEGPPSALELEVQALRLKAQQLETALDTSRDIGAATGIIMQRHSVTQPVAFALLARVSQNLNVPLRTLARDLVLTGDLPKAAAGRNARTRRRDRSTHSAPAGGPVTACGSIATSRESLS